jgi:hypothetical protein
VLPIAVLTLSKDISRLTGWRNLQGFVDDRNRAVEIASGC